MDVPKKYAMNRDAEAEPETAPDIPCAVQSSPSAKNLAGCWLTVGCFGAGASKGGAAALAVVLSYLHPHDNYWVSQWNLELGVVMCGGDGLALACPLVDVIYEEHVNIDGLGKGCCESPPSSSLSENSESCLRRLMCKDQEMKSMLLPGLPKTPCASCRCCCPLTISFNVIPTGCFYHLCEKLKSKCDKSNSNEDHTESQDIQM